MATDPARAPRAGRVGDPRSHLLAQAHRHTRGVIHTELRRLARRVPSLSPAELNVVNTALEELAETVILGPLRNAPWNATLLLKHIFDAEMDVKGKSIQAFDAR
ncbi:hypothetical protein ACIBI3_08265 [Actinomadura luteofluorescens]|uniref:hypothetical protein n=1 Tax=Actinomadura luteofluorescens TaxID=46163 RepID=UPI003482D715